MLAFTGLSHPQALQRIHSIMMEMQELLRVINANSASMQNPDPQIRRQAVANAPLMARYNNRYNLLHTELTNMRNQLQQNIDVGNQMVGRRRQRTDDDDHAFGAAGVFDDSTDEDLARTLDYTRILLETYQDAIIRGTTQPGSIAPTKMEKYRQLVKEETTRIASLQQELSTRDEIRQNSLHNLRPPGPRQPYPFASSGNFGSGMQAAGGFGHYSDDMLAQELEDIRFLLQRNQNAQINVSALPELYEPSTIERLRQIEREETARLASVQQELARREEQRQNQLSELATLEEQRRNRLRELRPPDPHLPRRTPFKDAGNFGSGMLDSL